jgi:hypothetical protein
MAISSSSPRAQSTAAPLTDDRDDRSELPLVWAGVVGFVCAGLGLVVAGFVPPPSPNVSAAKMAARFADDATRIRIGLMICAPGFMLIAAWGCVLAARTWPRSRALALTQVAMVCTAMFLGVLFVAAGQLATFRAGELNPAITLTLADSTFFILLVLAPFELWMLALALAILSDNTESVLPRWSGWLTIWCFLGQLPAEFISFTKTGPLAYNGVLAFWTTGAVFFAWMAIMTWPLLVATRDRSDRTTEGALA